MNDEFELGRQFDWQFARIGAPEDAVDKTSQAPVHMEEFREVGDQDTCTYKLSSGDNAQSCAHHLPDNIYAIRPWYGSYENRVETPVRNRGDSNSYRILADWPRQQDRLNIQAQLRGSRSNAPPRRSSSQ